MFSLKNLIRKGKNGLASLFRKDKTKQKTPRSQLPGSKRWGAFSLTKRCWLWLVLWIIALVFTQALRSPASSIFFGFVAWMPLACLIYALIARSVLKIYMVSDSTVTEKNRPFTYEFRIINESFLPYPFIDAYLRLPLNNSVRCAERCVKVSMAPSSDYTVSNKVTFRFRGTYEIGVACFYVYDFLRLFRVKVDLESYETVYVLPRRLVFNDDGLQSISDSAEQTRKSLNSYDKLEVSDIREYRMGDALKSIHWNLSSKTEELIVRDYNTGTTNVAYVFSDMSARFPSEPPKKPFTDPLAANTAAAGARDDDAVKADEADGAAQKADADGAEETAAAETDNAAEAVNDKKADGKKARKSRRDKKAGKGTKSAQAPEAAAIDVAELINDEAYEDMNEYCADGVVELTVATVLREIRAGREVNLMWFDKRSEIGAFAFDLRTVADFDMVFRLFATAPLAPSEKTVSRLSAMVSDTQDAKYHFVLPTIDDETISDLCTTPVTTDSASFGDTEVVVYSASERYAHPAERRKYIEGCRATLSEHGMKLVDGKLDDNRIAASESPLKNGENETGVGIGTSIGSGKAAR